MARPADESIFAAVERELAPSGLSIRGGFNLTSEDRAAFDGCLDVAAILLVGNAGGAFWPTFQHWRASQSADLHNPLDTWSRQVIDTIAVKLGARPVYPSDRPFAPFQQWAMRAEGLKPSPLGILMHPTFGPWHAYRGALLFARELKLPEAQTPIHLCDLCIDKPCKKACPVGAHAGDEFAYRDCLAHVRGADGGACRTDGCLDRNACPYGMEYRYPADMQAFIMNAFLR